ncbi:hypothetical protein GOBAR_AA35282 [Gossypium barbadense]|uniref:non-specific serine/threonine protein kinase n=1 Tax=Gossypium barbadense TaxID=3634 RepID=A0A2P5W2T6_GOSBA|nr:hypothetical protein GOBAR_AA35282 [Gossypium barbadense]
MWELWALHYNMLLTPSLSPSSPVDSPPPLPPPPLPVVLPPLPPLPPPTPASASPPPLLASHLAPISTPPPIPAAVAISPVTTPTPAVVTSAPPPSPTPPAAATKITPLASPPLPPPPLVIIPSPLLPKSSPPPPQQPSKPLPSTPLPTAPPRPPSVCAFVSKVEGENTSLQTLKFNNVLLSQKNRQPVIVWESRLKIAIGSAKGLAYLHEDYSPSAASMQQKQQNVTNSATVTADTALNPSSGIFTYEELVLATNGFSESNLIGQGGFGYVYKGRLLTGQDVAVKKLKAGSRQGEREFRAEVETISRLHHKHLVSLVGYCINGAERLLVYEFVPNRTLEFHLHSPTIIHRDIKAANILLDMRFEAKVSDFGLAKIFFDESPSITHISTRVMGTFGLGPFFSHPIPFLFLIL